MGRRGFSMGRLTGVQTFGAIAIIVAVLMYFLLQFGSPFGFTPAMGTSLFRMFPFIFVSILSIFIMKQSAGNPVFIIGAFGGIGISLSFLLNALHSELYLTDAMLAPASISQVMFWAVIVCLGIGGAVAMAISRSN